MKKSFFKCCAKTFLKKCKKNFFQIFFKKLKKIKNFYFFFKISEKKFLIVFFSSSFKQKIMSNFRNFHCIGEPDLSAGRLVAVPGLPLMLPLWYVKNLPTPNVGTGPLLPFHNPIVSFAATNSPCPLFAHPTYSKHSNPNQCPN